ncbi:hypothetical protein JG559_00500 [Enterococcus faecalis]|uniref:Uncharacterized protein n=1 Tax=Enterococcus faecalis TaxID=1351 RepID=A0A974S6Q3_ENTFL|nr:hypothetical protein JG559_00500 [Enterococcus faecalis]
MNKQGIIADASISNGHGVFSKSEQYCRRWRELGTCLSICQPSRNHYPVCKNYLMV